MKWIVACSTCKHQTRPIEEMPCLKCTSDKLVKGPYSLFEPKELNEESTEVDDVVNPYDVVNRPKHYCREGAMETIDEMEVVFGKEAVMNFCLLNVWKYRTRALNKNGEEDLKKSDFYMRKYKELKEKKSNRSIVWLQKAIQAIKDGLADKMVKGDVTIQRVKNIIRTNVKDEEG